jgi:DNA-binding XRE family transcriptional regulator
MVVNSADQAWSTSRANGVVNFPDQGWSTSLQTGGQLQVQSDTPAPQAASLASRGLCNRQADAEVDRMLPTRLHHLRIPDVPGCVGTAVNKGGRYEKAKQPRKPLFATSFGSLLASQVAVGQQQIDKLEDPDCNPTFETVTKVAKAFDEPLMVAFG